MPLTTPSGRTFKLLAQAPTFLKGGRGVTVSYQADSLDDPARIANDASDLLTAVFPQAVLGNNSFAVISATVQTGGNSYVHATKSFNTVFQQQASGEWLSLAAVDAGVMASPIVTAVAERYRQSDVASKALDFAALGAMTAPGYTHVLADGTTKTWNQDLADMKHLTSIKAINSNVRGIFRRGDDVFVVVSTELVAEAEDPKGALHRFKSTGSTLDWWVKRDSALTIKWTLTLEERTTPVE